MNIGKLITKVIPPSDFEHRDGFSNTPIIDKLNKTEKEHLEEALLKKLINETDKNVDTLIIDTLAYLHSQKAVPILINFLKKLTNDFEKIVIGVALFKLTQDHSLIENILLHFKNLDNPKDPYSVYKINHSFYYLAQVKTDKVQQVIAHYLNHKDYAVSFNARRVINSWNLS